MGLEGESPQGVAEDGGDGGIYAGLTGVGIVAVARLQEMVCGMYVVVLRQVLPKIYDFQFVTVRKHTRVGVTARESLFGRQCYPIDACGDGLRAIGLDCNAFSGEFKGFNKSLVGLQSWLSASEDNKRCVGILHHLLHDGWQRHHGASVVLCVAERARQVASAKADEHACSAGVKTFAL